MTTRTEIAVIRTETGIDAVRLFDDGSRQVLKMDDTVFGMLEDLDWMHSRSQAPGQNLFVGAAYALQELHPRLVSVKVPSTFGSGDIQALQA